MKVYYCVIVNQANFGDIVGTAVFSEEAYFSNKFTDWEREAIRSDIKSAEYSYSEEDYSTSCTLFPVI